MMTEHPIVFAFLLTLFAGLSTGVGSLIAFFSKKFSPRFIASSLGFSAGVMIYIAFVEILVKSQKSLVEAFGASGEVYTFMAFFAGILGMGLIDRFLPSYENPHEMKTLSLSESDLEKNHRLYRLGMFSAIAIAFHNFPEGLATFLAAINDVPSGIGMAVAVAIHNIPEGMIISVPIYFATKSRKKAFWLSFASGLAEPVGALLGYVLLQAFIGPASFGFIFAFVAGVMVYISFDELLPTAEEYGEHHAAIYGLIAGMFVMGLSLILL